MSLMNILPGVSLGLFEAGLDTLYVLPRGSDAGLGFLLPYGRAPITSFGFKQKIFFEKFW